MERNRGSGFRPRKGCGAWGTTRHVDREIASGLRTAIIIDDVLDDGQRWRDIVVRDRAALDVRQIHSNRSVGCAIATEGCRVTGLPGFADRVRAGSDCLLHARRHRSRSGEQREVAYLLGPAVVVDDDLSDRQLRCLVLVGEGAGSDFTGLDSNTGDRGASPGSGRSATLQRARRRGQIPVLRHDFGYRPIPSVHNLNTDRIGLATPDDRVRTWRTRRNWAYVEIEVGGRV